MTIEDDIAFLERIPVLRRLGGPALRILAIGAESYRVDAGQVLFTAGDTADGAFVVQRGSFTLRPERGAEADIVAGPGTLLGEFGAARGNHAAGHRHGTRETRSVLRIPRAMFLKMLEGYPDAARRLREVIAARADQWAREMDNVRATLAPGHKTK